MIFIRNDCSPSSVANAGIEDEKLVIVIKFEGTNYASLPDDIENKALTGFRNIIPTIMIGNNEMVLPAMYIINNVIGICFSGPIAISHDF